MKRTTLTLICPVYNEEKVIANFYQELATVLGELSKFTCTILFVLDRSTDGTLAELKKIAEKDPRVHILALSSRFGHQMSLLAGMDHANADAVIMMDTDLQHPPDVIPKLLAEYEKGFDIVTTRRLEAGDTGLLKRLTSRMFYRFMNLLSPVAIEESSADFRLISKKVLRVFQEQIRERSLFLRGLFAWVGFNRSIVEFIAAPRSSGRTKYSVGRLLRFAITGVVSFSKRPLDAAIVLGVGLGGLAFIIGAITFVQYFSHSQLPSGWTTLVMLITFYSAVHILFMGILGEYIGAIFDEVKGRPHYLVDEQIHFGNDKLKEKEISTELNQIPATA